MWKKAIAVLVSMVLLCTSFLCVSAQSVSPDDSEVAPLLQFTQNTTTILTVSGGQASATASFSGYKGTTTKVVITMTLQKKGFLGLWWSDETSWTETFNSYNASMNRKHSVSDGTYKVKAEYVAYSGSKNETVTDYSKEVKK